jgi:general secretion pathway protein C
MRTHLTRFVWVATLLFLVGGAYLSARFAALILAKRFWVVEQAPRARAEAESPARKADSLSDYRIISERNLFHVKPPAPPPPAAPPPVAAAPPVLPPPPPLPPLPSPPPPEPALELRVVGTAVVEGGKSFALISSGAELKIVKENEEILPGALLSGVRTDRVLVQWRGRTEEFPLFESRTLRAPTVASAGSPGARGRAFPPAAPPPPPPPAAPAPPPPPPVDGGQDTVRQTSEGSWVVDNREMENIRNNLSSVMTQVRVVPNFSNGQPDGFKIFAIRPGSIFAKIGLQNGDVIKRINGMEIQAPEQAFQAYQMLQNETRITVDLVRRDANKSLTYEIR